MPWYTLQTLPEYDDNYDKESGCEDGIDKKKKNVLQIMGIFIWGLDEILILF
jgi:hypothetical protein